MRSRWSCAAAATAITLLGTATGCGGDSSDPVFEPAPETVGTLSDETASEAIVQDVTALRGVMDGTSADDAMIGIYDLVSRATAADDVVTGDDMIREELPPLVGSLVADAPTVRERLIALDLRTNGGEALRDIDLYVLSEQVRLARSFAADVARSELAGRAVIRFGEQTNLLVEELNARIGKAISDLPPDQGQALEAAVRELFGD